jgi:hypothetical protein
MAEGQSSYTACRLRVRNIEKFSCFVEKYVKRVYKVISFSLKTTSKSLFPTGPGITPSQNGYNLY